MPRPSLGQSLLQVRRTTYGVSAPCRLVAQRRYPQPKRTFRTSAYLRASSTPSDTPAPLHDEIESGNEVEGRPDTSGINKNDATATENLKFYGSARRRAMRNGRLKFTDEFLPVTLSQGFLDKRVVLAAENEGKDRVRIVSHPSQVEPQHHASPGGGSPPDSSEGSKQDPPEQTQSADAANGHPADYEIAADIWNELDLSVKAGLRLSPRDQQDVAQKEKCHMIVNAVCESGRRLVRTSLEQLAKKNDADMVVLDALDIGRIAADHHHGNSEIKSLLDLGFEVYKEHEPISESDFAEDDLDSMDSGFPDSDSMPSVEPIPMPSNKPFRVSTAVHFNLSDSLGPLFEKLGVNRQRGNDTSPFVIADIDDQARMFAEDKEKRVWGALTSQIMRAPAAKVDLAEGQTDSAETKESVKPLIILIHDITQIMMNRSGAKFVNNLMRAANEKRGKGQPVLLVGSVSTKLDDYRQQLSDGVYASGDESPWQTLVLTPILRDTHSRAVLYKDRKRWFQQVNERQLIEALRHKKPSHLVQTVDSPIFAANKEGEDKFPGVIAARFKVQHRYLNKSQIIRMSTFIAGSDATEAEQPFSASEVRASLEQLWKSDAARAAWLNEENRIEREKIPEIQPAHDERLKDLKKSCTKHERKLLGGVVEPEKLKTTFEDVHVPIETIDALKTLTTLSLIRPDAFSYGVLANDKIPGLLLYGPPGTGKTLLAKAVAKESGAKVLEVSGAEINDMYVGESEKNIKALFSLAKKLTPCVIFIDEADAMFSSRTQSRQRTAHREMINQFLREWDGMSNDAGGAFIMVATNRPFDLDDAVLRRLPRRLLVDLPGEQDRSEILKIHLKDENLAEDANLQSLASKTPFYSGSDLKNLAVAAALNAVREENELANKHTGDEPYVYPVRRTITQGHFEKALEEITASISDDMETLKAIKKFDEQFGDRRGKKKKAPKWGFRTPGEADQVLDTVKVRG